MNHSFHSVDRATHLKIVAVALLAGVAVTGFGVAARSDIGNSQAAATHVIRAGKPVVVTSSGSAVIR